MGMGDSDAIVVTELQMAEAWSKAFRSASIALLAAVQARSPGSAQKFAMVAGIATDRLLRRDGERDPEHGG